MPDSSEVIGSTDGDAEKVPAAIGAEMRRLAHDLSNALEIIVQTSYLLGTLNLQEPASDWLTMMETGVQKALTINQDLRAYLKVHT